MWVFDKCCICIELRTGCFIIGYLQLVTQAILAIVSIVGLMAGIVLLQKSDEENHKIGLILVIAFVIMLLMLVPYLAFTIVYVVGLHKNKPGHVKAYLIFSVAFLFIYGVIIIAQIASGSTASFIQNIFYFLLNIYYLLVIRSYWLQMRGINGRAVV
ncbi:uncharacterized protein [Battus philenor]|uniref:uncharacterized protein n=1 Tax=Battus philenor TaxID=42288 RepID=UPI0035CECEE1